MYIYTRIYVSLFRVDCRNVGCLNDCCVPGPRPAVFKTRPLSFSRLGFRKFRWSGWGLDESWMSRWSLEVLTTISRCVRFKSRPWMFKYAHTKYRNDHMRRSLTLGSVGSDFPGSCPRLWGCRPLRTRSRLSENSYAHAGSWYCMENGGSPRPRPCPSIRAT